MEKEELTMKLIVTLLICSVFSAAGDYFSKQYVVYEKVKWLLGVFVVWSISTALWLRILKLTNTLATASKLWTVMYTVMMLLVSQLIFKEVLTAKQWAGIILGFVSLLMML